MTRRDISNWLGTFCFLLGTISMLSVHAASVAITPWIVYMGGNFAWLYDSLKNKQIPWATIAAFFVAWDALIICSRLFGFEFMSYLQPLITILDKLP